MAIPMNEVRNSVSENVDHLLSAAERFSSSGCVGDVRAYGSGNVHDTFLVTPDREDQEPIILQRLNIHVFRQPELVMQNIRTVTDHLSGRLHGVSLPDGRRWEILRVIRTGEGKDLWLDPGGSFWRALSYIPRAQPFDTVQNVLHAQEVGYALGLFHTFISDLPAQSLADTLPGFHITPRYLARFDVVLARCNPPPSPEMAYALAFVNRWRDLAPILEEARAHGRLFLRPIHGDPKVNNIMIDTRTHRAVSMIDLDTVKPGLVQYDLGDCLRSCCNLLGEETDQWEAVHFEPELCRTILQGYVEWAKSFLTEFDYECIFDAIRLIAFELGLRFLTDHLEGNVYFKARHEKHNLTRALVQFKLSESIEAQETLLRAIIQDLR